MKNNINYSNVSQQGSAKQELWFKIRQLNTDLIYDRMTIKHNWSEERTLNAIDQYRQYLYLTQVFEKSISPNGDVDQIWHEHILHTNKYALDCQKIFGKFLHHFPTPSKWNLAQKLDPKDVDSSFCCDNKDCCNDDPRTENVRFMVGEVSSHEEGELKEILKQAAIRTNGTLVNADCGDPAPGGCAPIGGSDTYCGGTTSDEFTNRKYDFDNPDMSIVPKNVIFNDLVTLYFKGNQLL